MVLPPARFALVLLAPLSVAMAPGPLRAQHGHHVAPGVRLAVEDDPGARALTVRLGPVSLPAHSSHSGVAQPPDFFLPIPFDGWLLAYHPRLVDGDGHALAGRLLHHVAFWNTARSDFLCPNKEEHIFGAGGEMNDWMALPGVGYRVSSGDRIRVGTMFHNPTGTSHPEVYLEVRVEYRREENGPPLRDAYPVWFDVEECGKSDYDLPVGSSVRAGEHTLPVSGRLLGVGGHLHDYGRELRLESVTRREEIARLSPEADDEGRILSMPVVPFLMQGGRRLEKGEVLRVTARYENPTGRAIPQGAMAIAVGYFLPDDGTRMAAFARGKDREGSRR